MAKMKLLVVCSVMACALNALYARIDAQDSTAAAAVQAAGRGNPYFNFQDGHEMRSDYRGDENLTAAMQSGQARPRSLASTDLNGDAAPDLVIGFAYNGTGIVTVQRGNLDAFAPTDESVFARMQQGYNPDPFVPTAETYQVPAPADFVQAGDFNNDNRKDVVVGTRGGGLFLLAGDGQGNLSEPLQIALAGVVTTLAAGEFRAADGHPDLAVGIHGPEGAQLFIYDGAAGGLTGTPMHLSLASDASTIQFGGMDADPFMDIAVASGNEIAILHGWGRTFRPALQSQLERVYALSDVRGMAVGHFIWDREGRPEIAALATDGTVTILQPDSLDTRPFTDDERLMRTRGRFTPQVNTKVDVEAVPGWKAGDSARWSRARTVATSAVAGGATPQGLLTTTNLSSREAEDVVVAGSSSALSVVRQIDPESTARNASQATAISITGDMAAVDLGSADRPVAVLQLPQKLNGERNLVVLEAQSAMAVLVPLVATPVTVDRTDDPSGGSLAAASVCSGAANDCSLRGAVQFANIAANSPTTITLPAGTYTLATNGTGVGGCGGSGDSNAIGDLGINLSTTITGAGSATTIIRQHGTGDRVMCLNESFLINLAYNFSGITVTGGRDTNTNFGGAGIIGGEFGNSLTLNNVVIVNNQTVGGNLGGSGIQILGGHLTVNNSTIGGSTAPGLSTDRDSVTNGNSQSSSSGAGIGFCPSAPQHDAATGNLNVTGTTFSHNTAGNNGGALDLFIVSFSGHTAGSGAFTIATSTFSSNSAAGSGGAIINESFNGSVGTTSFTSNSAGGAGGAIHVGGGTGLTLDGTSPTLTFTGNTAPTGSSVSASGAVFVSGTNTSIGGDIAVTTNGTWTNNAGSTLSPTNVVIAGGTFTSNNSTMNVGGNFSLGPEPVVGGTFNANTGTVNVAGNFSLTGGGSPATAFNAGTGSFVFNGAGAQSIGGTLSPTFNNLTVNKSSGVLTLALTTPVVSNLTVTSGTFDLSTFNANRTALGGTLTVSNGATLKIGGSNSLPTNYSTVSLGATSTVEYAGTGAQTINAVNYGHLTSSSTGGRTLPSSGTVGIAGAFTPGTNAYTVTGSTVNFNGAGGQTIPAFQFNHLTSSSTGARTLASSGTISIAGVFTPGTNVYTVTGSTVLYNGSSLQTLPSTFTTYNNLTLNNTAGTTGFAGLVAQGLLRVQAGTLTTGGTFNNVQIDAGTTLASSAATTINVAGSWTNNGGFTASTGTVNVNGGSAQAIGGTSATTFNNLIINAASGANLSADATVNGTLTLTAGVFGVGTRILTVNAAVSSTGGSLSSGATGSVNYNQASNGQNVAPGTYGNLTFSNFTKSLPNPGLVRIAGTFTTGAAGGHTVTGSTIEFFGSSAQSLPLNFAVYNNLTISNSNGVSFLGDITINGTLTLTTGALNVGAHLITLTNPIAGTATNLNAGSSSSATIAGSAAGVNLPSNVTSLTNLTLNNTNGTTLQANLAVSGALTLTTGILATGANILSLPAVATAARTSGYVNGNLKKTYAAPGSFNYLVGTANGFSPVAATITAGTGDLTVKATQSAQPNLHATTALQRYWTLSGTGVTANLVFTYLDPTDVAGTETNYRIVKVTGGTPLFFANSCPTTSCVDTAANTATVSGVSSFSDWTLAENADLSTAKNGPAGAIAGAVAGFDYTVVVTNNGPAANAGGFTVTDVLPAGVSFSAAGSDPACSTVGQTVTCATVTGLANGAPKSFVLHVTVSGAVAHGTVLANTATTASVGTADGNSSNNLSNTVNTKVFAPCGGCPFTDSPLLATVTTIKAVHIQELRDRIDVQRIRFGLAPYSWTDPTLTAGSTLIKAQHVLDLRTALDQAYVAHSLPAPAYTDPGLAAGTAIKRAHIEEPRTAVVALEGS